MGSKAQIRPINKFVSSKSWVRSAIVMERRYAITEGSLQFRREGDDANMILRVGWVLEVHSGENTHHISGNIGFLGTSGWTLHLLRQKHGKD